VRFWNQAEFLLNFFLSYFAVFFIKKSATIFHSLLYFIFSARKLWIYSLFVFFEFFLKLSQISTFRLANFIFVNQERCQSWSDLPIYLIFCSFLRSKSEPIPNSRFLPKKNLKQQNMNFSFFSKLYFCMRFQIFSSFWCISYFILFRNWIILKRDTVSKTKSRIKLIMSRNIHINFSKRGHNSWFEF